MSIPVIPFFVSVFVLRTAVRKRRPSLIWAASIYSRRNCSRSCRTGISRDLPPFSDLSFGLFQDPETPENRGFLVYLGLLGLRGSSGTARKQPESTKLGPRKSESLVGFIAFLWPLVSRESATLNATSKFGPIWNRGSETTPTCSKLWAWLFVHRGEETASPELRIGGGIT